ncbi:MAG: NAD(P)-dependent oxidoreductase [Gemmatimonadota bacterium]|nr:NAD(P)-dependent oxidoreductase [Gemmatimonadota bacterium]
MSAGAAAGPSKTVLVTGSAGFIGRHLVRQLVAAGYKVHGLDKVASGWTHDSFSEHVGDLLDKSWLLQTVSSIAPDGILHLAARTDLDETRDIAGYSANTIGVSNLLDAISVTPSVQRAICTSSQLVCRMGYTPQHDEDYQPTTVYGQSKVETEQRWRTADGAGRTWCMVRPTTIWGPGMNPHYLTFFALVRDGRYFHIAGGPTPKTFGYVANTVQQYQRLLEAPAGKINGRTFYLADTPQISLEQWAEEFRAALSARRIRTMPRWMARTLARTGDAISSVGMKRFPFTSFRLNNVVTPSVVALDATNDVCGVPAVALKPAVADTTEWLRRVWSGQSRWAIY